MLCGTAFKNKGVQPMLDAVVDYLPSPLDVPPVEGHAAGDEDDEVVRKPDRRRAVLGAGVQDRRRTRSSASSPTSGCTPGKVASGAQVINATKGKKERIGKLFQMHSNKENPVDEATAGHIYAVIGLKDTTTGRHAVRPGRSRSCSSR